MKKTKIVATIGPASETALVLKKMVSSGMNVCRMNFSHGDAKWNLQTIKRIRAVEKKIKGKIGILADIQGPRIRISNRSTVSIAEGESIFISDGHHPHNDNYKKHLNLDWVGFYEHLKKGDVIFIEDGMIQLEVLRVINYGCVAKVLVGGKVKSHKGVNIPAISSHLGFLTSKDLADLEFILSQDIDIIGVSFVASRSDLKNLKRVIEGILEKNTKKQIGRGRKRKLKMPWIISKVERRKAMRNIDEIIDESDGIMVARGDLAIEAPQEKVTIFQKDIIKKCRKKNKPVIVATQMMASMVSSARPTRAEISDVTNAVIDNADAVMLSNESSVGKFPVKSIETMTKIITTAEKSSYNDVSLRSVGKLAKMLFKAKHSRKRSKIVYAQDIKEGVKLAALRQEDVSIRLKTRNEDDKRKATLVWGLR
ncbi:pyruvate kinase [bacterium]|jgi:pyruvate kinase|nr:pyruvate kinase [bacterium]MBT4250754.1 pyruvate kinase [bacterium]MBT4598163.1 pyruvate kinase [bacterium]MBT6753761.1 pyruvate kinase [bacterium]MBT7037526.1 pyruvate kinase [bacterium]